MSDMAREDVERLVRIETKLDEALQRLNEDRRAHDEDMAQLRIDHEKDVVQLRADHEKDVDEIHDDVEKVVTRVSTLENWRYAIGAALLMSSAASIGAAINMVPK